MCKVQGFIFWLLVSLFSSSGLFAQDCPTDELGRRNGECSFFNSDKNRWITATFQNGNLHGVYQEYGVWRNSRILRYQAFYINGELNGFVKSFRYDGKIETEQSYLGGLLNGPTNRYQNGILDIREYYLSGEPHGEWIFYDARGRTETNFFCQEGVCGNSYFYDNKGRLVREIVRGADGLGYQDIYYNKKGEVIRVETRPNGVPPEE